jgi:hypothetical protein
MDDPLVPAGNSPCLRLTLRSTKSYLIGTFLASQGNAYRRLILTAIKFLVAGFLVLVGACLIEIRSSLAGRDGGSGGAERGLACSITARTNRFFYGTFS